MSDPPSAPAPAASPAAPPPSEAAALEIGTLEATLPPPAARGKQHRSTKSPTAPEVTPHEPGVEP